MKTKIFEEFRSEGLREIFVYQNERELVEVFYTIYKDCTIYAYKHENDWIELDDGAIYETYANLTISSPNVAEDFEKEYIKYKREKKLNRILNI